MRQDRPKPVPRLNGEDNPQHPSQARSRPPGGRMLTAEERRTLVLECVADMICSEGLQAVTMNRVASETRSGKAALYQLFGSRDGLIAAHLHVVSERVLGVLDEDIQRYPGWPKQVFEDVIDRLNREIQDPDLRPGLFQMIVTAYPDPEHPLRAVVAQHQTQVLERLTHLMRALAGVRDSEYRAGQLMVMLEGARISALVLGPTGPARVAIDQARQLIRHAG